jgi:3-hydroxy acid dehydrogenase / malonic semialdehyde reductase
MTKKTVLITGVSSGFGKATAKLLAKEGYQLILVARRKEILQKLQKELKANTYASVVDVTDRVQVEHFFAHLTKEFQQIDVLINCAGLALGMGTADEADLSDWETMVDTNIKGLLYFTQYTLKLMKKSNTGLIVNLGSVAAHVPYKGGNVYGATKAFVRQFSRNLRTDLLGTNIKVTTIEPGMAETEFSVVRFKGNKKEADKVYKDMRPLVAEDIAQTIVWIINRPAHVNIDNVEIMPTDQTFGGLAVHRK